MENVWDKAESYDESMAIRFMFETILKCRQEE